MNRLELVDRLEPRDAFVGDRTNAVQLNRRVKEEEGEEIRYGDYTSFYPWVNKNCVHLLHVGNPAVRTQPEVLDAEDASEYVGLAKCTNPTSSLRGAVRANGGVQIGGEEDRKEPWDAMRSLAKIMLNSFWGKFGQQSNKCLVEALSSPHDFYKLITSDDKDIHSIRVVNEDMLVYNNVVECHRVQAFYIIL